MRHCVLLLPVFLLSCSQQVVATSDPPPEAVILAPTSETIVDAPGITFIGQVDDNDPGDQLAVVWTSDLLEEPLWEGSPDASGRTEFTVNQLPIGTHVIELRVTDTANQQDTASITLEVTAAIDPPDVVINEPQPGDEYLAGVPVDFEGIVIASDGSPGFYDVEWVSDQEGPIYTGSTSVDGVTDFDTLLTAGTHLIQLRVFDGDVTLALESVTIEVSDLPPGQLDQDFDGFCPDGIDADGDGRCRGDEVTGPDTQDCNDAAAVVCPGCPEVCDGFEDNDCDGVLDPDDQDLDGDGWTPCAGDCNDAQPLSFPTNPEVCDGLDNDCSNGPDFDPAGEVDADGDNVRSCEDCNDNQPLTFPGNTEVCDGVDNDCNGVVDDSFDSDNDGWTVCEGDCNDNQPLSFPGNAEVCDDVDNDCDGSVDEGFDNDGDGWATCEGDCNDVNPAQNPGAAEVCDGGDNDCDGTVDEGFDNDGDGWTTCAGDCNDNQPAAYPGRPEICDNIDNDCDGSVDEGFDNDGDGWATCEGDCNDANSSVYPGAAEICDTVDNDCDGQVNETYAGPYEMWETGPSSPGYQMSGFGPQLVFGSGTCSIGGFLVLQPGNGNVNGTFHSPQDLYDIYEFDTGITTNAAAWFAFLASGQGLPPSCTSGQISWSSTVPISVTAQIDGTNYSGAGTNGAIGFNLGIFQLFDVDYKVTVQPIASWAGCSNSYTLNFVIP